MRGRAGSRPVRRIDGHGERGICLRAPPAPQDIIDQFDLPARLRRGRIPFPRKCHGFAVELAATRSAIHRLSAVGNAVVAVLSSCPRNRGPITPSALAPCMLQAGFHLRRRESDRIFHIRSSSEGKQGLLLYSGPKTSGSAHRIMMLIVKYLATAVSDVITGLDLVEAYVFISI